MKKAVLIYATTVLFSISSCTRDNNTIITPPEPDPIIDIEIPVENTIGVLLSQKNIFDGYTLFTPSKSKETYLINNRGQVINQWTSSYLSGKSVYLLEDGSILRAGEIKSFTN